MAVYEETMTTSERRQEPARHHRWLIWLAALGLVWVCLWLCRYVPTDGDGWLYTQMTSELSRRGGLAELWSLKWYGFCKIYNPSELKAQYFFEHPPGLFMMPALLASMGFPAAKATLFADTLYQLVMLFAIFQLMRRLLNNMAGAFALLLAVLLPISFVHALRATQETPMLMCVCLSLVGILYLERAPLRACFGLFVVAAFAALLKGLMVAPLIVICGFGGLVQSRPGQTRLRAALGALLSVAAGSYLGLTIFEKIYMATNDGQSFWLNYLDIQLWHRALEPTSAVEFVGRSLRQLGFYTGALAWYAAPAWLILLAYARQLTWDQLAGLRLPQAAGRFTLIFVFGILLYLCAFSVFARVSVRYIVPAYYLMALAGLVVLNQLGGLRWLERTPQAYRKTLDLAAAIWCLSRCAVIVLN